MRYFLPLLLASALFGNSVLEARVGAHVPGSPAQTGKNRTLQERLLEVPQGTMIEVRLHNMQKLRGRLGEMSSEGFNLQTAQGSKVETQKLSFADVKSFKKVDGKKAAKTVGWVGIGVLAGIVAGMVVVVLILVTTLVNHSV